MSYSWTDYSQKTSNARSSSDASYMYADSSEDAFMSSEGCYDQTFSYQTQPNSDQWATTSYSMPLQQAYSSQPNPIMLSTAMDSYSPSFSGTTSPITPTEPTDLTDPSNPYLTMPADKESSQTAREERRRAQNRESQRAFRERKNQQIKDLEQNLAELQTKHDKLQKCYSELSAKVNGVSGSKHRK